MNTADILDKAADLIDARGLAKKRHVSGNGCLCAAGAMYAAVGVEPTAGRSVENWPGYTWDAAGLVRNTFEWFRFWLLRSGRDFVDPIAWNDAKERTATEVVSTLRAAAQAARAES